MNFKTIGQYLTAQNLWDTPLRKFSEGDIKRMAEVLAEAGSGGFSPPYITERGSLVIPYNAPLKYRWWQGGQSIMETLTELNAPQEVKDKYL